MNINFVKREIEENWGIELCNEELILKQFPNLKCCICQFILKKPTVTPCHHMFCEHCILQAVDVNPVCPMDRNPIPDGSLEDLKTQSLAAYQLIFSMLQVKCPLMCSWTGDYDRIVTHLENDCNYRQFDCIHCRTILERKELNWHLETCLDMPLVCEQESEPNGSFCKRMVKRRELKNHQLLECEYRKIACGCGKEICKTLIRRHWQDEIELHLSIILNRTILKFQLDQGNFIEILKLLHKTDIQSDKFKFLEIMVESFSSEFQTMLLKTIDMCMTIGYSGESMLYLVHRLYKILSFNDGFCNLYRRDLGLRLSEQRSSSIAEEEDLIEELSVNEQGKWRSVSQMIKDYKVCVLTEHKSLDVQVFITSPFSSAENNSTFSNVLNPPSELVDACNSTLFNFLKLPNSNMKKLHFQFDRGNAEVEIQFSPLVKSLLKVSTLQMFILLELDKKILKFKDLKEIICAPASILVPHLMSLIASRIILHKPDSKVISDAHMFKINSNFKGNGNGNENKVFIVPMWKPSGPIKTGEDAAKLYTRKYRIDNQVVRELKCNQALDEKDLYSRVCKNVISEKDIAVEEFQKSVARLIDQEYAHRDVTNTNLIRYRT